MKNTVNIVLLFLSLSTLTWGGEVSETKFRQALRELGNDFRLLCFTAHPDDEDGATLAYYRYALGVDTYVATATRGEGGQNRLSTAWGAALGVLRSGELYNAADVLGTSVIFMGFPDFGWANTAEETFAVWGRDALVREMVAVIRRVRPQVVISPLGLARDHGHHQAVGIALREAFAKAAQAEAFPELIAEGLLPWQPMRLFLRVPFNATPSEQAVPVPVLAFDDLLGRTYTEIALEALEKHRSQDMNMIMAGLREGIRVYYEPVQVLPVSSEWGNMLADSRVGAFFEGLPDVTPEEIKELSRSTASRAALKNTLLDLARQRAAYRGTGEDAERQWAKANAAAVQACQLQLRAKIEPNRITPGSAATIRFTLVDYGERDAVQATVHVEPRKRFYLPNLTSVTLDVPADTQRAVGSMPVTLPASIPITLPHEEHVGEPYVLEAKAEVVAEVVCGEYVVTLREPLYYDVAPPVEVSFPDAPYLVRLPYDSKEIRIPVRVGLNDSKPTTTSLLVSVPPGWGLSEPTLSLNLERQGRHNIVDIVTHLPTSLAEGRDTVGVAIPETKVLHRCDVVAAQIQIPEELRVGVIAGPNGNMPTVLRKLGVPFSLLTTSDYSLSRLQPFSAVLVDFRGFHMVPEAAEGAEALMEYVKQGGTLVVLSHWPTDWGEAFAPFALKLSTARVADETAPVEVLAPEHRVFHTPNPISANDWNGWEFMRAQYVAQEWAPEYTALLRCHDAGQDTPEGLLLVASYGRGYYVYTALTLPRQTAALHPGSLRLLVNLLSLSISS